MTTAVDANVVLDVLEDDPVHGPNSEALLRDADERGRLVICHVVYAELAARFETKRDLDGALRRMGIEAVALSQDVAWLAGKKFAQYRRAGGSRTRLLADFLIGAHAELYADRLLTRDRGFYRTYFPELELLER